MMKLKIAVVASDPLIADEITHIISSTINRNIEIQTYRTDEIKSGFWADIYVCAQTQLKRLSQIVEQDKIVLLDLMPNSKFFLSVAQIPQDETIYIFNNYLKYAVILAEYCQKLGITGVKFVPIAYREMPGDEVRRLLKKAKYVIGVDRFVGEGGLLSLEYRGFLREDITVIPAVRAASVSSSCRLIQCAAIKYYQYIAGRVEGAKIALQSKGRLSDAEFHNLQADINHLRLFSNEVMDMVQGAVTKSVLNNITSDMTLFEAHIASCEANYFAGMTIHESIEAVTDYNNTLKLIAGKLSSLIGSQPSLSTGR